MEVPRDGMGGEEYNRFVERLSVRRSHKKAQKMGIFVASCSLNYWSLTRLRVAGSAVVVLAKYPER